MAAHPASASNRFHARRISKDRASLKFPWPTSTTSGVRLAPSQSTSSSRSDDPGATGAGSPGGGRSRAKVSEPSTSMAPLERHPIGTPSVLARGGRLADPRKGRQSRFHSGG